ncbi:MAG: peptidoglycan DD-metalloendopeptidase family protein [Alphaproteobacteria bacterium]
MKNLKGLRTIFFLGLVFLLASCGGENYPQTAPIILGPHQVLVGPGDTVYRIAYQHGVSTRALIEANRLASPYFLNQGQILVLPDPSGDPEPVKGNENVEAASVKDSGEEDMDSLKPLPLTAIPHESEPGDHPREGLKNLGERPALRQENVLPQMDEKSDKPSNPNAGLGEEKASKIAAPKEASVAPPSGDGKFPWPVEGSVIGKFGRGAGKGGQDGIRIAASEGTSVKAIQAGKVIYVGDEIRNLGNLVLVQHKGGWISAYGHLGKATVAVGDTIKYGQSIGSVGKTGTVKEPQLYFELRKNKKPVDPLGHLRS